MWIRKKEEHLGKLKWGSWFILFSEHEKSSAKKLTRKQIQEMSRNKLKKLVLFSGKKNIMQFKKKITKLQISNQIYFMSNLCEMKENGAIPVLSWNNLADISSHWFWPRKCCRIVLGFERVMHRSSFSRNRILWTGFLYRACMCRETWLKGSLKNHWIKQWTINYWKKKYKTNRSWLLSLR